MTSKNDVLMDRSHKYEGISASSPLQFIIKALSYCMKWWNVTLILRLRIWHAIIINNFRLVINYWKRSQQSPIQICLQHKKAQPSKLCLVILSFLYYQNNVSEQVIIFLLWKYFGFFSISILLFYTHTLLADSTKFQEIKRAFRADQK